MINNGMGNNQDQGNGERGNGPQDSGLAPFGPQAFLSSLLGPVQPDGSTTASTDVYGGNQRQSMMFDRNDSNAVQASLHLNADMSGLNAGVPPPNQRLSENDTTTSLYNQPKQNLSNIEQVFGVSGNMSVNEFRSFFGSSNGQDPGGIQSDSSASAPGLSFRSNDLRSHFSSSIPPMEQRGTGNSTLSRNLNLHPQNTLNFNQAISLSAQDTLRSQMNLHNALNNSWQQPLHLQQSQQPSQQQSLEQASVAHWSQQVNAGASNDMAPLESSPQLPPEIKWKGRGRSSTFPLKLHQMLLDLENQEGGRAIASFLPHGRGFQIHRPKEFSK